MKNPSLERGAIVIGAMFGDEGKGTTVDFLCGERKVDYVIRFSGGPQTAHNVVTVDGKHHTFSQFGAGSFKGVPTILSEFTLINPFNMVVEAEQLMEQTKKNPFETTYISENALLITPIHVEVNRYRERLRGGDAHGSCGEGIGEARAYELGRLGQPPVLGNMVAGDLLKPGRTDVFGNKSLLHHKMEYYLNDLKKALPDFVFSGNIDNILDSYEALMEDCQLKIVPDSWIYEQIHNWKNYNVFEGSQGILLDEAFGFHPHTTWSAVTDRNARILIARAGVPFEDFKRIGVVRTYTTRHGYGPFPSEFAKDGWEATYPEVYNGYGEFQGSWRAGLLDLPLLEYATRVNNGFDEIMLTHCDIPVTEVVTAYEDVTGFYPVPVKDLDYQEKLTATLTKVKGQQIVSTVDSVDDVIALIEDALGIPVTILSYGPTDVDKKRR